MTQPLAWIEVDATEERSLITVFGEIDLSNAVELGRAIGDAIDATGAVVIDMRPVEFMDSQGVRMLHELATTMAASGVALEIVAPPGSIVGQVLRLTQMDAEVPVREDLDTD